MSLFLVVAADIGAVAAGTAVAVVGVVRNIVDYYLIAWCVSRLRPCSKCSTNKALRKSD